MKRTTLFLFLITALLCSDVSGFSFPETLRYNLTWTGIKAGDAVLEATDDGTYIRITSRATSAKWVSVFYTVEDVVVSTLKRDNNSTSPERFVGVPHNYRVKLREGRHRRDKEIIFNPPARRATYINHLEKETADFDVTDSTFDVLSSFYYVRTLPLEVGKPVFVEVFDSKKLYRVEVQVLKKETVTTALGTFSTIVIKPAIQSEGTFYRKGDILIWLTDDERRIPVLMKTKVSVGSITATLVSATY